MRKRVYNFSAGPSMLAEEVLKKLQKEMLSYEESGMSVMEMSHRSKVYLSIFGKTKDALRRVLDIPEDYEILFMQGGATMQFSCVPLNLMKNGKADYIITGSELDENSCRSGFNFNGQFLRFGSPRSDILFNPEQYKEKIYKRFKLNSSDHILIYAPTFRAHSKQKYFMKWQNLNFDLLIESLNQKWNGEWKIFLRLHPFVKFSSKQVKLSDKLIDVSNYENSQELIAASDILISDFSSIIFEFSK